MSDILKSYNLAFLFIFILILATPLNGGDSTSTEMQTVTTPFATAYTLHDPISIGSDADFATQAGLEGWEGNGSSTTPYIIEDYEIYSPGTTPAISITWISETTHYIIRNCSVSGFTSLEENTGAFRLFQGNGVVTGCEIYNSTEGMYIQNIGKTIEYNTFWNCSKYALTGKSAYYAIVNGNTFDVTGIHAMFWQQCDNSIIENNQFLADITGGPSHQLEDQNSVNLTIRYNSIITSDGDFFLTSDDVLFHNNHVQVYGNYGLMLRHNKGFTVTDCVFEKVGGVSYSKGVFAAGPVSENIVIANSSFLGLGLTVWNIMNCSVYNCSIIDAYQESLDVEQMLGTTTIYNNTIRNSLYRGVFIDYRSVDVQVFDNIVDGISQGDGIQLRSNSSIVFNNTVYNCQTGIRTSSDGYFNVIYDNRLYSNTDNAYDGGAGNNWDNGTIGNYWDDYSGTGFYYVPGPGAGIDYFPVALLKIHNPNIDGPSTLYYEFGSLNNWMNWIVTDHLNGTYIIEFEDNTLYSGTLSTSGTSNIQILVDGHNIGTYNYTLILLQYQCMNVSIPFSIIVTADSTTPTISGPDDFVWFIDSGSMIINWTAYDNNPEHYEIRQNGTIITWGNWNSTGEVIQLIISDFDVGMYEFEILVSDIEWNNATDSVTVVVLMATTTTTDLPPVIEILTVVITIVSASVIIIVLILIYRGRKA